MKHRATLAAVVVPICAALALTAGPTYAGAASTTTPTASPAHAAAHTAGRAAPKATRTTSFAFRASGFGTRVVGGQVPAGSSTTGYQVIGCTNQAGRSRTNHVGRAALPGLGTVSGVRTHVWTTSRHGVVTAHSTHTIGKVLLARSALGSLSLDALTSRARATHDSSGFHATTHTHLGDLTFTPPAGPAQSLPAPTPDQPVTVPGLATVYVGQHVTHHSAAGASARAFALRVDVVPTGTSIRIARSYAALAAGLTGGVFSGHSAGTRVVTAAGDIAASGPNPLSVMPCQGTHGRAHEKSLASTDLGGQLVVKGARSQERGSQGVGRAHGTSRAEVARVALGGQLVINGIVGKVSVSRHGRHVSRSTHGTRLGTVTVAGQRQTFPKTGVLEIPGVAKLERAVTARTHHGIRVIGLRITLLDGSGAVVDLAEATLRIRHLPT